MKNKVIKELDGFISIITISALLIIILTIIIDVLGFGIFSTEKIINYNDFRNEVKIKTSETEKELELKLMKQLIDENGKIIFCYYLDKYENKIAFFENIIQNTNVPFYVKSKVVKKKIIYPISIPKKNFLGFDDFFETEEYEFAKYDDFKNINIYETININNELEKIIKENYKYAKQKSDKKRNLTLKIYWFFGSIFFFGIFYILGKCIILKYIKKRNSHVDKYLIYEGNIHIGFRNKLYFSNYKKAKKYYDNYSLECYGDFIDLNLIVVRESTKEYKLIFSKEQYVCKGERK